MCKYFKVVVHKTTEFILNPAAFIDLETNTLERKREFCGNIYTPNKILQIIKIESIQNKLNTTSICVF